MHQIDPPPFKSPGDVYGQPFYFRYKRLCHLTHFWVVMIAVKHRKSVSFLKLEPFIPTDSTNDFLLFDPFIVSIFVQHVRTKAVTSNLFTPLFMFIHLPLIHFALPSRLLVDFKNSKWLTYFCISSCISCFSHPIGLFSVTWLSLLYKFTRFFLWRRANVRLYYPHRQYTNLFILRNIQSCCTNCLTSHIHSFGHGENHGISELYIDPKYKIRHFLPMTSN